MIEACTPIRYAVSLVLGANEMTEINVVWLAFEPLARVAFVRQAPFFPFSFSLFPR